MGNEYKRPAFVVPRLGTIYFLQIQNTDQFVKIGFATNLVTRLSAHQVSCPYEMKIIRHTTGYESGEKRLQEYFKPYQVRGEWFHFTQEMLTITILEHKPIILVDIREIQDLRILSE